MLKPKTKVSATISISPHFKMWEPKKEYDKKDKIGPLISKFMCYYEIFHRLHLNTKSYSKHMALDALYKELPEYVDALAEIYLSCDDNKIFPQKKCEECESMIEGVECLIKCCNDIKIDCRATNNALDNLTGFLTGILYKLKDLY